MITQKTKPTPGEVGFSGVHTPSVNFTNVLVIEVKNTIKDTNLPTYIIVAYLYLPSKANAALSKTNKTKKTKNVEQLLFRTSSFMELK